ncbi:MAG: NAD(P)-dependent oxidoreductase [Candidatus Alcyoniella australis]|nr:NAD(P)-dependent oxidoreductase [Candidatus Alcyoniella australis]
MKTTSINLITGGSGVLGRALSRKLCAMGQAVRVFDLSPPDIEIEGLSFVIGDVTDRGALCAATRGCSRLFHLAAAMPQAALSDKGFERINLGGTANAAQACIEAGVDTLVLASSIEIYGPQTEFPIAEDAPKLFTGPYSRNKWDCERLLLKLQATEGLRVSFARMPMIIGPGFYHERSMLRLMRMLQNGRSIPLPAAHLPYHVVSSADAADALWLMATSERAVAEAFNVAAPDTPEVKALFRELIQRINSQSRVRPVPMWLMRGFVKLAMAAGRPLPLIDTPPELLPFVLTGGAYDISKARELLGFEPRDSCLDCLVGLYRLIVGQTATG